MGCWVSRENQGSKSQEALMQGWPGQSMAGGGGKCSVVSDSYKKEQLYFDPTSDQVSDSTCTNTEHESWSWGDGGVQSSQQGKQGPREGKGLCSSVIITKAGMRTMPRPRSLRDP